MNMDSVFVWTGFICLTLITIALTLFFVVALLDMIFQRTKVFNRVFKIINKFYESFPYENRLHRYVVTLYDYETQTFIDHVYLNNNLQTDEEWRKQCDEMRKKHARKPSKVDDIK